MPTPRRTLPLLAVTALVACVLALPGCGKGDGSQPRRQKEDGANRQREDDAIRTEGNPPADGHTPFSLHVVDLALSPDGRRLLTSFHDVNRDPFFGPLRTLSLWDTETGKELWAVCGDKSIGYGIRWLPDGKHFLAVAPSRKGRLSVWDGETGVPLRDFGDGTKGERVLAVSADGKCALAAAGTDLRVCSLPTGETITHLGGTNKVASYGALSPDGMWALANFVTYKGSDGMALWEVGKPKPARVWGPSEFGSGVAFSPDGKRVLSGVHVRGRFYKVLRELRTGKEDWRVPDWGGNQFTPDGNQILVQRGEPGTARILGRLDAATGKVLWESKPLREDDTGNIFVSRVCFSSDGSRAAGAQGALGPRDGPGISIQLWDATTGKSLRQWRVPRDPPQQRPKP
jgi:WD40 repeat protein